MNSILFLFTDIKLVYFTISLILSIGLIISTSEDLVNWNIFKYNGLLSWKVAQHRSKLFLAKGVVGKFWQIFDERIFYLVLISSFILSAAFFITTITGLIVPLIPIGLLITRILLLIRTPYGLDGAYQMSVVLLIAVSIAFLSGISSRISELCLWFLSGELTVSYLIAGGTKIISPIWRKSYALNAIFSTRTYGHGTIYYLVTKYDAIPKILCWMTLGFELGFPLAFLSEHLCIGFCLIGFTFHLFNAIFMGLNTFLFFFIATYPALLYCITKIH
ncbi:MAG: hypothetical protein HY069_01180 [Chlamydiia bacterium]|nr:hypothetical protein [Chlamydiia bacterium]